MTRDQALRRALSLAREALAGIGPERVVDEEASILAETLVRGIDDHRESLGLEGLRT